MRSPSTLRRHLLPIWILAGIVVDALLTGICYRLDLNLATTSLLFLLVVVAQALGGGVASSVIASIAAAGFLDYFFVQPVLTWRIADPFDAVALLVFVSTSLIVTTLASKARTEARRAERQRKSLEELYQASQRLLSMAADADVIPALLQTLRQTFALPAVCLFDGTDAEIRIEGESAQLAERTRDRYMIGSDNGEPEGRISTRCLRHDGRLLGAIGFENLRDPELTVGPLVTLTIATLERARAAQAASRAAAEAKAEVLRAAVLDGLAHEFKTPLAVIVTAAGGIREAGPLAAEQWELAEAIEEEAARLGQLTTRLLRKTEADAEEADLKKQATDLGALIGRVVERYSEQFPGRRIRLERYCEFAEACVDEEMLSLALSQLLDNALKYSRPGSAVVVRLRPRASSLDISVWNRGFIASGEKYRIFDRFQRGSDGQRTTSGTGLGLYVARKIARAHGGTLEIDPDGPDSEGVTFRLSLPALEKDSHHDYSPDQSISCR
jgi:two-component system sensor histidine kinase KdpD